MDVKLNFTKRIIALTMMLSILGSTAVLAASETLFGYTVVNSGYSQGEAGAISGERTALSPGSFTAQTKITQLNGDPALFNFFQGNESRLVLRQYNYTATAPANQIVDPFAVSWTPVLAESSWSNVANLHAVATKGQWLYATCYDLARISVVNMNNSYAQSTGYQFPTAWPGISLPSGAVCHGEELTVVGNYLYALFTVNPNGGYTTYSNSIVVKFYINSDGTLRYINKLEVGKNAFTLEPFNNKLYVCALGGMQNAGSANADTCLDVIDLDTFTKTSVAPTAAMGGDFRDITIVDANNAYVFVGHYDASFNNMLGGVYHTSVANLTSPALWTQVNAVNAPGYLWGIYADANRLWFVKGNQIDIFAGLPTGTATAAKTFTTAQLSSSSLGANPNLNSATIVAADLPANGAQLRSSGTAKSFAAHSVLAQQARKAAQELKGKKNLLRFN